MARLTDKLQETVITSNPQTAGLAGEIRPFAGDTSGWPVVDGVRQLKGWAVCEGDILNEADYPDLCANLGGVGNSPWDNFAHPTGQTGTVGAGQFRLPKLNGLHLKSAGDNGVTNPVCGEFQDQGTVKNSLETSASNISATFNSLVDSHSHSRGNMDITGAIRFSKDGNVHHIVRTGAAAFTTSNTGFDFGIPFFNNINIGGSTAAGTTNNDTEASGINFRASRDWTGVTSNHNINYTPTLTSGSAAAQALTSTDDETRPTSVAVSYIIALYNNVANVITTNDLTVSNVTVTGGLTTDTANATTVSADTANVTTVSADNVSATTYSGLPIADGSTDGIITTGAQTIAGNKTFSGTVDANTVSATTYSGLPEATTSTSGVVKKNKWQRRTLGSSLVIDTNSTFNPSINLPNLKFANLDTNKIYRLTLFADLIITAASTGTFGDFVSLNVNAEDENSNFIIRQSQYRAGFDSQDVGLASTSSTIFKAQGTEINFELTMTANGTGSAGFLGNNSWAQLEELNDYDSNETTDFTPTP